MATRAERRALLLLGLVAALGASVRAVRLYRSDLPEDQTGKAALQSQIEAADSARRSKFAKGKKGAGKRGAGFRTQAGIALSRKVDLDVASEPEIEALRGIGPSLARRIVADRDSFGPFGSTAGLRRVRGVGAALVARLDSSVTFSLVPRPMNTVIPGLTEAPRARVRRRSKRTERDTLP